MSPVRPFLLLCAAALLGATALAVRFAPTASIDPVPSRPASSAPAAAPAAAPPDRTEAYVSTVLTRPLFAKDRRPQQIEAGQSAAGSSSGLPRLSGIVIAANARHAIFEGEGKPIVRAEGESVGAYTVLAIAPGGVTVDGPSGKQTLQPSFDAARRAASVTDAGADTTDQPTPHAAGPGVTAPRAPNLQELLARQRRGETQ